MSARYRFLPWVRQGAATAIPTVDTLAAGVPDRPSLPLGLRVNERVDVPVEMDDPDLPINVRCGSSNARVPDRVIPADDDRKHLALVQVLDSKINLVERLLQVGRDDEHVPGITHLELGQ